MPCPDLGALRASLDVAAGAPPAPVDHLRTCPSCADTLAELQRNAELAAPAIALTAPADQLTPAQIEAALAVFEERRARLTATRSAEPATGSARTAAGPTRTAGAAAPALLPAQPAPWPSAGRAPEREGSPTEEQVGGAVHTPPAAPVSLARRRLARLGARTRVAAAALVAALVLTGLVVTPGGRAAASSFLAQFRSQRFEVLSVDPAQANQVERVLTGLADTGVFTGAALHDSSGFGEPQVAADRAEAARLAGFAVPVVDPAALPKAVGRAPRHLLVSPAREVRLTFDRDKALAYLRAHGRPDAQLPERYDGTRLVIAVPAAVVQEFAGRDGLPALLVGKAGTLGLTTEGGASLEELREVVLGLPGLPADLVAQLRGIGDWRNTLPLPIPADQVRSRPTAVNGAEALSFADDTGRLRALVWQRDGHIWGVAGMVGADEVRDVANRLG
jgi:hypothetical protein